MGNYKLFVLKKENSMKKAVVFCCLLVFILAGCEGISFPDRTRPDPGAFDEVSVPVEGPVVARVGDWAMGTEDFERYLESVEPIVRQQNIDPYSEEFRRSLLEDIVQTKILAKVAAEQSIADEPEVAQAIMDYRDSLLASRLRFRLEEDVIVYYDEVERFYEQNKDFLRQPTELRIREMAVPSRRQAEQIYIDLLRGGSFSALARENSVLDSAGEGGDLGYIGYDPDRKFDSFWNAAAALESGDISSIFRGPDGNHYIIKAEDVRGGEVPSLADIEEDLREALKIDKLERRIADIVADYRRREEVEINEDRIR